MAHKALRFVGYWSSDREPDWPDVVDFIDADWDLSERLEVHEYLRRGRSVADWMGYSECRICGKQNGASDYSDGTFVWPEGLGHYVLTHSVRLPTEVIDHILACIAAELEILGYADADAEWWRSQGGPPNAVG